MSKTDAVECKGCRSLDAIAAILTSAEPSQRDESALTDLRVLRKRHEQECPFPRGGGE